MARKAVHTACGAASIASGAASKACGAASIASGVASKACEAASIASGAASKAVKRVTEAARAGEQFEDGDETLGVYLLAGDGEQVRRFLSLAQAAYLQETTSWPEIVFNQGKNLRCVGSVTSEGVVEIGFRGTIVHGSDGERNLDNWIRVNARVAPVPLNADFGLSVTSAGHDAGIATAVRVHSGFQQAYSLLRPAVLAWLSANGSKASRCVVVGHSLGGALATLCALDLLLRGFAVDLVTFGCPRVGKRVLPLSPSPSPPGSLHAHAQRSPSCTGNRAFSELYAAARRDVPVDARVARLTNRLDPVARVPPHVAHQLWSFSHVGAPTVLSCLVRPGPDTTLQHASDEVASR